MNIAPIRSATWHSGRKQPLVSLGRRAAVSVPHLERTLRLVCIAPLGGPVVPDV